MILNRAAAGSKTRPTSALANADVELILHRTPSIRSRLALLVLACLVPAAFAAVALLAYHYWQGREALERDSIATARAMTFAVDRELTGTQAALRALATSPDLMSDNLPAFYNQAKDALRGLNVNSIVLIDRSGQQLNTLVPFGVPIPTSANPPLDLQRVFETDRSAVTNVFVGPVVGKPLIAVGVPVRRRGQTVYILSAGILPEQLGRVLTQQRLPADWIGAIFDSTGTIVARTHDPDRFIGKRGSPALVRRMSEVAEDSFEAETLEGIPVVSIFSRSAVSNWTVAIGIPKQRLNRALLWSVGWLVLGTVILFAGGLGLTWIIGGRITKSIHGLTGLALALGEGEHIKIAPLGLKEADEVAEALARTSVKLRRAQHQALHDPLTSLANRMLLSEVLAQQVALCHRTNRNLAILYIDLDGFKEINDRYGHAVGDRLLCALAVRFKAELRESDIPARLGGDEFVAILLDTGLSDATNVASKLVDNLSMPYDIDTTHIEVSVSIGVAAYPASATNAEALLDAADQAMYKAKAAGKKRYWLAA